MTGIADNLQPAAPLGAEPPPAKASSGAEHLPARVIVSAPPPAPLAPDALAPRVTPLPVAPLAASAVPPLPSLASSEPASSEPGRSRLVVLAAIVALLALAGGAGWYLCGAQIRALLKV